MSVMSGAYWTALGDRFRESPAPVAIVMASTPQSIALFFTLSACRAPLVLLSTDPRQWQCAPALPEGMRLVLPSGMASLEREAVSRGFIVTTVAPMEAGVASRPVPYFSAPGLAMFTSGSTGLPRPTYRTFASLLAGGTLLTRALNLHEGSGVIGAVPLDRAFGLNNCVMTATLLRRPLALVDRSDARELLALFETGAYGYWPGTPVLADVLPRMRGPRVAPAVCLFAGRVTDTLSRAFNARFGVRLRQMYGATETLTIAADLAPHEAVRSNTAGRVLEGVSLRIGDAPEAPVTGGLPGRIWVRTPALADGYGVPRSVSPLETHDGWWASPDAGHLDADGVLTLTGRVDDQVRTGTGQIVNPHLICEVLERHTAVVQAVAGPVETASGAVLGALVEASSPVRANELRQHMATSLPRWAQPRVIEIVKELPRLPNGRPNRAACLALLRDGRHQMASHD